MKSKYLLGLLLVAVLVSGCVEGGITPVEEPAKESRDLCAHINDTKTKRDCYFEKYVDPAVDAEDFALCDGISTNKYTVSCYNAVAYNYGAAAAKVDDSSICEKIEKREFIQDDFPGQLNTRDVCYFSYIHSSQFGPRFVCNSIENKQLRSNCYGIARI